MFSRNAKYYEWLPAYLEDGLDEARKAQMQARLAADPVLAVEAERLRRMLAALKGSAARENDATHTSVPPDLWPRLQRRLERASSPRPIRQIGWMAGVGATAALALVAALWLPMEHSGQPKQSAKIVRMNPPVQVALTPPKSAVQPAAAVATTPRPVELAQAAPSTLTSAIPTQVAAQKLPPVSVATSHKIHSPQNVVSLAGALPKPTLVKPIPVPMAKPTLMASRIAETQSGDRAMSVHGLAPLPTPGAANPENLAMDRQAVPISPPPMAAYATVAPQENNAGQTRASTALQAALPQPAPRDMPQANAPTAPHFQNRMRRMGVMKAAVPPVNFQAMKAAAPQTAGQSLEIWQATLSAAIQQPLWGEDVGAVQATQALLAVRQAGLLDTLRSHLEAKRVQSPQDIYTGRMLAAVYDFGFGSDLALSQRRRIAALSGADGEDWFALAQAEEHAGNAQAARAAYRRALASVVPLNSPHAALARLRE